MMRWLYTLAVWLTQPLLRRKLARRGVREPRYLEAVEARFGHYSAPALDSARRTVWIHAVSLGETRTAALLLARLRARLPGMRLLLTHGTATGLSEGAKLLQAGDCQTWQPWDSPGAVRRFLDQFSPCIGILMETEIWPNLVAVCAQRGVPLVLANARMSEQSLRKAQRLIWLARPAFGALRAVWPQTEADAQRLRQLGAPVQVVLGNLKFDAAPNADQLASAREWRRRLDVPMVVVFASSREGEEAELLTLLAASASAESPLPGLSSIQWLIVPRHPQRFDEVAALIQVRGWGLARRSQWRDGPPAAPGHDGVPVIWLGDSLGEMALYYGLADVALLGGSFAPLGGQNLIEAAACGCPVLMGPHTFNFAQAAELASCAGAAREVPSLAQALTELAALQRAPARLRAMAEAASGFAVSHRGAADKTAAAVVTLLGQQGVDQL